MRSVLAPVTDFELETFAPPQLAECRGRIACMVRMAEGSLPRFLLVISVLPGEGSDYFSVALVDTKAARAVLETPAGDDEQEPKVIAKALVGPEEQFDVSDARVLPKFFAGLVERRWRPAFEASGHFRPNGAIELSGGIDGAVVRLDERDVATFAAADAGAMRLEGVAPGTHQLAVTHAEVLPCLSEVVVGRARTSSVSLAFVPRPGPHRDARTVVFWSGVGLAIAGVGVTAYGVFSGGVDEINCWGEQTCATSFRRFGGSGAQSRVLEDPAGGGIPVAPLGYGMTGAGAAIAGGTYFFADDREWPWIPVAIGLGVGVVTFALSAALDPTNAVAGGR
jgi:hypothetical protein